MNNKGITLISLVVTIIILLILAGVSIALVSGGNGILDKATNAVDETTKGSAKEELELYLSECKTNCYEEKYVNGTNISLIDLIDQDMNRTNEKETKNGIIKLDKENKKLIYKINDKEVAEIYIEDIGSGTGTSTVQKYSIKYIDGTNIGTKEKIKGIDYEIIDNIFNIPKGYKFKCWNTQEDGNGTDYTVGSLYNQDENLELYAQWTANEYKITFDANGGEVSTKEQEILYDSEYGNLPTPTANKCTFLGWGISKNSKEYITNTSKFNFTSDITLYALWKLNVLEYSAGGSSANEIYKSGSTVTLVSGGQGQIIPSKFYCDFRCGNHDAASTSEPVFTVQGYNGNTWETLFTKTATRPTVTGNYSVYNGTYEYETSTSYTQFRVRFYSTDNERYLYCSFSVE